MLLRPSEAVFQELIALGAQEHATLFGNTIDCTEQGFLNAYFNGAEGREVTKLDVGRADVKADWKSTSAPFAVHWITHVCPKPWLVAGIRVRVGRDGDPLFRKKGRVLDVLLSADGKRRATLALDGGGRVDEPGYKERYLETALPKDGGPVRCVLGDRMGAHGVLCLLYTSPSPRDRGCSRMPSSA